MPYGLYFLAIPEPTTQCVRLIVQGSVGANIARCLSANSGLLWPRLTGPSSEKKRIHFSETFWTLRRTSLSTSGSEQGPFFPVSHS